MKNMKSIIRVAVWAVLISIVPSCQMTDLDINTDPNNPTEAAPSLLLSEAQIDMAYGIHRLHEVSSGIMNQQSWYDNWVMQGTSFNFTWSFIYSTPLKDIEELIKASTASGDQAENPQFLGIAQLMKAYMFGTMVDYFGDLPYSEALRGNEFIAPKFDKDQDVYKDCIRLIDAAVINLNKVSPAKVGGADLIYGGDKDKWITFANSIKIKMLMNMRLADPSVNADLTELLEDGDYINEPGEDFTFKFSKQQTPDYRHPWYSLTYGSGDNGFNYFSSELMVKMIISKDPRFPFYFRRQTSTILDQTDATQRGTTPCTSTIGCLYGYIVLNESLIDEMYPNDDEDLSFLAGILGRDRADPAGVPNDGAIRTMPGVYPCGGYYDVAAAAGPGAGDAPGGGIFPMLTHVHMGMIKAEAVLASLCAGDARAELETAVTAHIADVSDFGVATDDNSVAPDSTSIADFVGSVMATYDAASNKTGVVMQQLWYVSPSSSMELYNMFRRNMVTSTDGSWPGFLQDPLETFGRKFPFRLAYPQGELSLNANAAAYQSVIYDQDPIFWDTNN
jgi:Starch-binding associating with outer membrane